MTPSKDELDTNAKHFANTVFVIMAGIIMLIASMLQGAVVSWMGENGGDITFIAATLLILLLAAKRPRFALYAIGRQCAKHGHTPVEGSSVCSRCHQSIPGKTQAN